MHGHTDVRAARADCQLVVRNRIAGPGGPPGLIPRRVRGENQMSLAFVVDRLLLEDVVTEAPLALVAEPSATPEVAAPEISITMMPGLVTPPEVL